MSVLGIRQGLARLGRFSWTVHNMIAHPVSEVLWQLGYKELSHKIHDCTIPVHAPGLGRG